MTELPLRSNDYVNDQGAFATRQLKLDHFVSTEYLSIEDIWTLIERGVTLKESPRNMYPQFPNHFIANLFFEPSTRTHTSFEVAENKLGMQVIQFDPSTSSANKGETLFDTVLTLQALGIDTLVIRSSEQYYYKELIDNPDITVSVINGGDGSGQHPSQSLLDMITIYQEFRTFKGLKIAIMGDLSHSRVARSDAELLYRLGADLYFGGPREWIDESFEQYGQYAKIDDIIDQVDVMMLLRVQNERHERSEDLTDEIYHQKYGLTIERAEQLQDHAIIMHPAPVNRGVEIADELVVSPHSRIYHQMENGLYARMAILEAIMYGKISKGVDHDIF